MNETMISKHPDSNPDTKNILRQLYQKKYIEGRSAKGVVERVLGFQKKIRESKSQRNYCGTIGEQIVPYLDQQESRSFRPASISCSRTGRKRSCMLPINQSSGNPTPMEFRLLKGRKQGISFVVKDRGSDQVRERNLYSIQQERKMSLLMDRHQRAEKGRMTPLELVRSDRQRLQKDKQTLYKAKNSLFSKKTPQQGKHSSTISSHNEYNITTRNGLSKRVFIGGQDLQKAGEEYQQQYSEVNRNLQLYQLNGKRRDSVGTGNRVNRTSMQRSRRKGKVTVNFPLPVRKNNNRTEIVKDTQEEEFNMEQFNPWHVEMTGQYPS